MLSCNVNVRYHPCVVSDALFVRGRKVCDLTDADRVEMLTLWGASFTVFAEKLTYNSCRSTSTLLCCVILKTDKLVGKQMTGKLSALLKDLDVKVM